MSEDGEIIVSGSDLSPMLTKGDVEFLNSVDTVITQAVIQSDPMIAFNFGRALWKDGHLKGLALAKFLAKLGQQWGIFQMGNVEERFEDAVNSEIGISPQTVRKYADMWENLFENEDIPTEVKAALYGKPIKSLLLLTAAARDGDELDWNEVAMTSTGNEIRDLVREARGEQTSSSSAIRITLDRNGDLKLRRGMTGETVYFGHLDTHLQDDPDVKRAITRIVERAGIQWL